MVDIIGETGTAVVNPLLNLWNSFVEIIPGLVGALLVLVIGYLIAWLIGLAVKKILYELKVDRLVMKDATIKSVLGGFELSSFLGLLIKWWIFVAFISPAASLISLTELAGFLGKIAVWIPSLIAAILVSLVGLIAADYAYAKIHEIKAKSSGAIASVIKIVIVIFTLIIALSQLGIDVSVAESSFLIILAGIMLAIGLGFGLALKDELKPVLKDWKKKL